MRLKRAENGRKRVFPLPSEALTYVLARELDAFLALRGVSVARTAKQKRVFEAMLADKVWDKKHNVKQGSPQDKAIDASVRRQARKGR